jgi:hypothetical protein
MNKIFKVLGIIAIVAIIGFSFTACGDDSGGGGGGGGTHWKTWVSTLADGDYDSTSQVSITTTPNDTSCDVSVTGTANNNGNWASQVLYNYTATVGKKYKVSWKWAADGKPFTNVTIRYAQQKDYQNDSAYELGTDTNRLTIPVSEKTEEYEFTMPDNCFSDFTFKIGEDIGSFKIRDFKVVEVVSGGSGGGGSGSVTFTINGLTPNTVYYVVPGFYEDGGFGSYLANGKQGRSNAAGSVTVSYSSADLRNTWANYWGKEGKICYATDEWHIWDTCSKQLYKMTSATYTLTAPGDFDYDGGGDGGGDGVNIDGWSWYVYNDSIDGGTSTVYMTQGSGNDSKKLTFFGDVRKIQGEPWGYAGWGADPDSTNLTALKNANSFSFKCTGTGKKYWVQVLTSDVTDFDYHYKEFTASPGENTITVNYSDLAQQGFGVNKSFNKNNIIKIEFQARPEANVTGEGSFSVTMWDLR